MTQLVRHKSLNYIRKTEAAMATTMRFGVTKLVHQFVTVKEA